MIKLSKELSKEIVDLAGSENKYVAIDASGVAWAYIVAPVTTENEEWVSKEYITSISKYTVFKKLFAIAPDDWKECLFELDFKEEFKSDVVKISRGDDMNTVEDEYTYKLTTTYKNKQARDKALKKAVAYQKLVDKIAELNHKYDWVCDWSDTGQDKKFIGLNTNWDEFYIGWSYPNTSEPTELYFTPTAEEEMLKWAKENKQTWLDAIGMEL